MVMAKPILLPFFLLVVALLPSILKLQPYGVHLRVDNDHHCEPVLPHFLGSLLGLLSHDWGCATQFFNWVVHLMYMISMSGIAEWVGDVLIAIRDCFLRNLPQEDADSATVLPLRRARVLLKCMELLYKDRNANDGETSWTAEHLGEEVLNLLIAEDLEHDSAFVVFRSHHTVAVHLWLSLFAYHSAGLLMTSTVSYHVEEACNILYGLIPNSSIETDPKMTRSPTHAKKLTRQEHGIFSHHVRVKNVSNVIQSTPSKETGAQKVVFVFDLEIINFIGLVRTIY
ncbi:hypothetical protein BDR06DRAFT_1022630 [Suillus hirtellus]|nr:hypothetical protein BDR06DRAFT_1022630 [Suillus hirtellus]